MMNVSESEILMKVDFDGSGVLWKGNSIYLMIFTARINSTHVF